MKRPLMILHLFPELLSDYGDSGNLLVLRRRLEWRDINYQIQTYQINQTPPEQVDLIVAGGNSSCDWLSLGPAFSQLADHLQTWLKQGVAGLFIAEAYPLLGHYYQTLDQTKINGTGLLDFYTVEDSQRRVGNMVIDSSRFGSLLAYENHNYQTFLGDQLKALGKVRRGFGNNAESREEGLIYRNFIASHGHGPLLAKNPQLADFLIQAAWQRIDQVAKLKPLDDILEVEARSQALKLAR